MAEQDNEQRSSAGSVGNTLNSTAQAVSDTKKAAKSVAKATKQSGGTLPGFAAAMAKEIIKDPAVFLRCLRNVLIATLAPFLIIVLVLNAFGAAVLAFLQQVVEYGLINNASHGNILLDITLGNFAVLGNFVVDLFTDPSDLNVLQGKENTAADGSGDSYGEAVEVNDELSFVSNKEAPSRVLQQRIAVIQKSVEARVNQFKLIFGGSAGFAGITTMVGDFVSEFFGRLFTEGEQVHIGQVNLNYVVPELTDLQAIKIMCAYSMQRDIAIEDVTMTDLRFWIGCYSWIVGGYDLLSENAPVDEYYLTQDLRLGLETADETDIIPLNISIAVPRWFGKFKPQYLMEQDKQRSIWLEQIKRDGGKGLTEGQKTAALTQQLEASQVNITGWNGRGLIDYLVYMGGASVACSYNYLGTAYLDLGFIGKIELLEQVEANYDINVVIGIRDMDQLSDDIIGFWEGPLFNYDVATKKNRPCENEDENLLKYQWKDDFGNTYTRMQGYQKENYIDMVSCLASEFGVDFAYSGHGGDGSDIVAVALEEVRKYGGQSNTDNAKHYWSEYYGSKSDSTAAWCCCFVYVCANYCGYVGEDNIFGTRTGSVITAWERFKHRGQTHIDINYRPSPGDLIFFDNGNNLFDHIGIVEYVGEDGRVYTIEGNSMPSPPNLHKSYSSYKVGTNTWKNGKGEQVKISGYASPAYPSGNLNAQNLKATLESEISTFEGTWSVYVAQPSSNLEFSINDVQMPAGGLEKLFVAGAYLSAIGNGEYADNYSTQLQKMLTSDDTKCEDEIIELLGIERVNSFIKTHLYGNSGITAFASDAGQAENYVTVANVGKALLDIRGSSFCGASQSVRLQNILNSQATGRRNKIPAGVPETVPTGNLSGFKPNLETDAAIVYAPRGDYALVIIANEVPSRSLARTEMKRLSSIVYNAIGSFNADGMVDSGTAENSSSNDQNKLAKDYLNKNITQQEIELIAWVVGGKGRDGKTYYNEIGAGSNREKQAVAWEILNRFSAKGYGMGESVSYVVSFPGQYGTYSKTFASTKVSDATYKLVYDVCLEWAKERVSGRQSTARVIGPDYRWHFGDGKHNSFYKSYEDFQARVNGVLIT